MDTLDEKELENITGDNLFLTLVESKKFSTPDMIEYLNETLNKETFERKIWQNINRRPKHEQKLILEEIKNKGMEEYIIEKQKQFFDDVVDAKENRKQVFSNEYAFLTHINNKIYDFALAKYFNEEEYYINYSVPFSKVFKEDDWEFICINEEGIMIAFTDKAVEILNTFWQEHFNEIDKTAKEKILKLK